MGGGGKGGDAPDAPDYIEVAKQQGTENRETARISALLTNPNYNTPWGSQTVDFAQVFDENGYNSAVSKYQDELSRYNSRSQQPVVTGPYGLNIGGGQINQGPRPEAPNRNDYISTSDQATVNINLSDGQQALFDADQRLSQAYASTAEGLVPQLQEAYSQPFDFKSAADARNSAESALMDRLNPYLERDQESRRTQLLQSGFVPGTEAFSREMADYNKGANDARLAVIGQAGHEQDRQVALASYLRNLPLQEINALRGGSQVQAPSFPGYSASGIAPADIQGAAQQSYQTEVAAHNAQAAASSSALGGLFSLGGAAIGGLYGGLPGASIGSNLGGSAGSLLGY